MKRSFLARSMLSCLILAVVVVLLAGPALAGDLAEVKQRGVLRHLGIPYANFVTGAGDGLDVELMKLFARHLGVKYQFVKTDWAHVISDLVGKVIKTSGSQVTIVGDAPIKGDVIANGLTILSWRQKVLNFSTPTFPTQVWLIAPAKAGSKPIEPTGEIEKDIALTKAELKGKKVFDKPNTCLDSRLYNLDQAGAKVFNFDGGLNDMAPAVIKGDADMTLLDVPDALVALGKWPQQLKVIGPLSEQQGMGVGFRKSSPELLKACNEFLDKIWRDGTYFKLVKKYYPAVFAYYMEFFKVK